MRLRLPEGGWRRRDLRRKYRTAFFRVAVTNAPWVPGSYGLTHAQAELTLPIEVDGVCAGSAPMSLYSMPPRPRRQPARLSANTAATEASSAVVLTLRGEPDLVKTLGKVIVQVCVLDESRGNRLLAQQFGFGQPMMPFLRGEVALADTHQRI
jgi:hypothetical protein